MRLKAKGNIHDDAIHQLCGEATRDLMKLSLIKQSADNITVIIIAFENFKKAQMAKIDNFHLTNMSIQDQPDLGSQKPQELPPRDVSTPFVPMNAKNQSQ